MDDHVRTIEVSGHKFEVDLRTAKKVDEFRVGDKVKLLHKERYESEYKVHPGVIVGIDAFQNLPTIVVAYVPDGFLNSDGSVKFAYLNAQAKDLEICAMCEDDIVPNQETIATYFDRAIKKQQLELDSLLAKKEFFLRQFGVTFGVVASDMAAATASATEDNF